MAGYYADAEKYQISSWLLGCIEKEIGDHVIAERERIIKLICEYMDGWESQEEHMEEVIALIKGEK